MVFFVDMYNPKNNPFRVPMDNDIFTLREKERDEKLQVIIGDQPDASPHIIVY